MNDDADEGRAGIIEAVTAVLDRHGIAESQQLKTLAAVLRLNYQQARRRMNGESPFTIVEVERLALHFGEPVFELLAHMLDSVGPAVPATMHVGTVQVPCSIWPGRELPLDERVGPLVALPGDQRWTVVTVGEAAGQPAYEVRRWVFEAAASPRVAVLDDEPDVAEPVAAFLREKGLSALAYLSAEDLRTALDTTTFDGYVLDFTLGKGNVTELLPAIRQKTPAAPIVILTGGMRAGRVAESELARVLAGYRCMLYEKPAGNLSLYNALTVNMPATARP